MNRPNTKEIKAARDRIRLKGKGSDDVVWLSMLALKDPECRETTQNIAFACLKLLGVPEARAGDALGIINGAFIAGLHLGLELKGSE